MNDFLDPDEIPQFLSTLWPLEQVGPLVLAGINDDDCAIIKLPHQFLVITTDYLNSSPIVLELGIGSFWDLGRLVVASNLSDLCSSGAEPIALMLAIMMKRGSNHDQFMEIIHGVKYELNRWGVPLIGGDSKLGASTSILGIALGSAEAQEKLFLRNRAKPDDLLWVSGNIGSCSAATLGLSKQGMPDNWQSWAKRALLDPQLPLHVSKCIYDAGIGNGGIDISDGLGADLCRLCKSSNVGAVVDVESLPTCEETKYLAHLENIPSWGFAFGSGGDFQFLVTTRSEHKYKANSFGLKLIGEITSEPNVMMRLNGELIPMPQKGHRDAHGMTFAQEVRFLIEEVRNALQR
jgi:thiamine-monophosphate kinase